MICRYCGATLDNMNGRLVDVVSGDVGGTYDYCPENPAGTADERLHEVAPVRSVKVDSALQHHQVFQLLKRMDGVEWSDMPLEGSPKARFDITATDEQWQQIDAWAARLR